MINRGKLESRFDAPYYANRTNYKIQTTKLKYIAKVKGGKRIPKGKSYSQEITDFKYLRVDDIDSDGNIDFNKLKSISKNLYLFLKRYEIFEDEIIISNAGTIGKIAIMDKTDKHVILTENAVKLILFDNQIDNNYLKIILNTKFVQEQMKQEYIQTTIPKLSIERISNLNIPIVEKTVQQKIIDIMDNASKVKKQKEDEAKKLLDGIDDYLLGELGINLPKEAENTLGKRTFQVRFEDVFSNRFDPAKHSSTFTLYTNKFEMVDLKEIVHIDPQTIMPILNEEVTFLPMERISDIYGIADVSLKRRSFEAKGYTKFKNGDLLWSKITPCMENGKSAVVEGLYNGIGFGSTEYYVFRARSKSKVNIYYIHFLFRLNPLRQNAKLFFTGSSGHLRVDKAYFNTLKIPLPPMKIQNNIVNELISRRNKAIELKNEAKKCIRDAQKEIEKIILGDSYES